MKNSARLCLCLAIITQFIFVSACENDISAEKISNIEISPVESKLVAAETSPSPKESFYIKILLGGGLDDIIIQDDKGGKYQPYRGLIVPLTDTDFNANASEARIRVGTNQTRYILFPFSGFGRIEVLRGVGERDVDSQVQSPSFAVRYNDINIPKGSLTKLTVKTGNGVNLSYDEDGNGSFEKTVEPSVVLNGKDAEDVTPPKFDFKVEQTEKSAVVTVIATDDETGVKSVRYSLDEKHFSIYNAPIKVDYSPSPIKIDVFAEDRAGNRSSRYTKIIKFENKKN